MTICYSRPSKPTARTLRDTLREMGIEAKLSRSANGDINWGRYKAETPLNPNIRNSTDKLKMRQLFREHKVPAPILWDSPYEVVFPCVARTREHSRGRGFWLCNNPRELDEAISQGAVIFMEYIEAPKEFRVHIFQGKSIRISEKSFYDDENPHNYVTIKPTVRRRRYIREAARQAVEAVGLDFAAVDVLATDDQAFVLEVNAAPSLGGTMPSVYAQAFASSMG
jgi:glutathione synthase/RimK-type ligase-like ATP-grasp enzyme